MKSRLWLYLAITTPWYSATIMTMDKLTVLGNKAQQRLSHLVAVAQKSEIISLSPASPDHESTPPTSSPSSSDEDAHDSLDDIAADIDTHHENYEKLTELRLQIAQLHAEPTLESRLLAEIAKLQQQRHEACTTFPLYKLPLHQHATKKMVSSPIKIYSSFIDFLRDEHDSLFDQPIKVASRSFIPSLSPQKSVVDKDTTRVLNTVRTASYHFKALTQLRTRAFKQLSTQDPLSPLLLLLQKQIQEETGEYGKEYTTLERTLRKVRRNQKILIATPFTLALDCQSLQ